MNILVINSGSSSLKYQLIDTQTREVLQKGTVERIGDPGSECPDHKAAVKSMFTALDFPNGTYIHAVGHRVVHGGESFKQSTLVTEKTLAMVEKVTHLAPLHNPANLMGVRACMEMMPDTPNVMVFDTAFHSDMPPSSYLYALPMSDYKNHGIRRYGFHGTSHNYVSRKCAQMYYDATETSDATLESMRQNLRIITCHLGNGCSIAAIDKGKSVETSMGLTPLEGLVMGTRSGDIDPAAVQSIAAAHNFDMAQTINYLNKECGIKGLAGIGTSDMRDIATASKSGNKDAQTAIDVFTHRIVKYIGAYVAAMGGVDAIVWTGGIGNNKPYLRTAVAKKLAFLGGHIDTMKNDKCDDNFLTMEISTPDASVRTFIIKTEEELEIATQTAAIVGAL